MPKCNGLTVERQGIRPLTGAVEGARLPNRSKSAAHPASLIESDQPDYFGPNNFSPRQILCVKTSTHQIA